MFKNIYMYNWLLLFHTVTKDNERGKDSALTAERGEGIWTHETTAKKVEASSNTIFFLYALYCTMFNYSEVCMKNFLHSKTVIKTYSTVDEFIYSPVNRHFLFLCWFYRGE
jgi:hypothetical protein